MKILCFGDSNTYGYDPRSYIGSKYEEDSRWVDLLRKITGHETVNRGMNGRCIPKDGIDLADADLAARLAAYKENLKKKIEKANEDLKGLEYEYKTN